MLFFKNLLFTLGLLAAMATATKAMAFQGSDEVISSISAEEMVAIMEPFNWQPEIFFEDNGQKTDFIMIQVGDISSWVKLLDCTGETFRRCNSLLFFANFDLGGKITSEFASLVNSYNDTKPVGRAYYISGSEEDGDQVGVDLRITLHDGVTVAHLKYEAVQWQSVIDDFMATFSGD